MSEVQRCSYLLEQNVRGEKCSKLTVIQPVCYTHFGVLDVSYDKRGLYFRIFFSE